MGRRQEWQPQCQGEQWVHRAEGSPAPFTYLKLRDLGLCGLRQDFGLSFDETFLKSHKEDAGYSLQDQSKHPKSSQGRE